MRNLKKSVMRRIYFIWFLRQVTHPLFLKIVAVALLLGKATSYVSLGNILTNWPLTSGILGNYGFIESAFVHTETSMQVLVMGISALSLWLAYDVLVRRSSVSTWSYN